MNWKSPLKNQRLRAFVSNGGMESVVGMIDRPDDDSEFNLLPLERPVLSQCGVPTE
jgi:hypothetical protein